MSKNQTKLKSRYLEVLVNIVAKLQEFYATADQA